MRWLIDKTPKGPQHLNTVFMIIYRIPIGRKVLRFEWILFRSRVKFLLSYGTSYLSQGRDR